MSFNAADTARRKKVKEEIRQVVKETYGRNTGAREVWDYVAIALDRGLPSRRQREQEARESEL